MRSAQGWHRCHALEDEITQEMPTQQCLPAVRDENDRLWHARTSAGSIEHVECSGECSEKTFHKKKHSKKSSAAICACECLCISPPSLVNVEIFSKEIVSLNVTTSKEFRV